MMPVGNIRRRQIWADMLLLMVTLIWGGTFVMVKEAVTSFPVFLFLALRFALAFVILLAIGARRLRGLGWRGIGAGVLIGLVLFAGYAFQTFGLRFTTASKAGFITGLSVTMVPVFSALLLRQRPRGEAVLGVILATLGMALMTLTDSLRVGRGDLLVFFCAISFALHIITVSAFAPDTDPLALTIIQVGTVALLSAIAALLVERPWPLPSGQVYFAAAFTGVLATALAFAIQTSMQRFTTPTHTAVIFAAEPVFAALFGILLAGDVLTPRAIAGAALILCGTLVTELEFSQRTARWVSRFISPNYMTFPLLIALGLADQESWPWGILWAVGLGIPAILGSAWILLRELHRGKISDWHLSNRHERLKPVPVIASLLSTGLPLAVLWFFDGPRLLLAAFLAAFGLVVINLIITLAWKISQHVSSIALTTTLMTVILGPMFSPLLLLIPMVAWARVKVGAHSVMQTIAGGVTGIATGILALRALGLA